ncbi:tripartite tricarboxylate transporter substrate binding protein [Candidimonas sp. SYP-B2681]|uniref:Bug family tripartite tricarboxylate transporter substrate binding protein n=1 Tax=Candidimonas sp. SYP-B2681 TaxID=2497686 RepID=UPI000F870688|nr:tripartite tricarboxylate transporter substrate binding protein [Candidimonas sp. SYP-B2681]RTZ41716.1 tripartite tricarboxylate transporter substrate binding protein [Candidimonas sp. SYP-B2681]
MKDITSRPCADPVRRRLLQVAGAAGLTSLVPAAALAATPDTWPGRPINYVVPFAPGGLTDVAARTVAKTLSDAHGWNIVIENKSGGSANIGAAYVARAVPDGHTWLAITLTHASNATLFAGRAGYDLLKDLVPVAGLAASSMMVVVNAKSPIRSIADLNKIAKERSLNAGSSGNGTPPHLTLALYQKLTGNTLIHIPYKGGTPSMTDLMGGHLDVIFSNYPESLPHVKSGALRALAVTTTKRSPDLPDVPTVAEAGLPELIVENMTGVLATAGTPDAIVQKIGKAIVAQVGTPAMRQSMINMGFIPQPRGPAEFKQHLESEVKRWHDIIKSAGITVT